MVTGVTRIFGGKDGYPPGPLWLRLAWNPDDPYAVTLTFMLDRDDPDDAVTWVCGRELLAQGLTAFTGNGDVQLGPVDKGTLQLRLHSPDGTATYELSSGAVWLFLRKTYRVAPLGAEEQDVDTALARLLEDA